MGNKAFTNKETTKEQYLKFKEFIKDSKQCKWHWHYVAYYMFKHRIVGEDRDKYLEDEVRNRCYKAIYHGRMWYCCGGECTEHFGIPNFKNLVIKTYNEYADAEE